MTLLAVHVPTVSQQNAGHLSDTKQYENEDLEVTSALRTVLFFEKKWTLPFDCEKGHEII